MSEIELHDGRKIVFPMIGEALRGWSKQDVVVYLEPESEEIFDTDTPLSVETFQRAAEATLQLGQLYVALRDLGWSPWVCLGTWSGMAKSGMVDEIVTDFSKLPRELGVLLEERLAVMFWSDALGDKERVGVDMHVHLDGGKLVMMEGEGDEEDEDDFDFM